MEGEGSPRAAEAGTAGCLPPPPFFPTWLPLWGFWDQTLGSEPRCDWSFKSKLTNLWENLLQFCPFLASSREGDLRSWPLKATNYQTANSGPPTVPAPPFLSSLFSSRFKTPLQTPEASGDLLPIHLPPCFQTENRRSLLPSERQHAGNQDERRGENQGDLGSNLGAVALHWLQQGLVCGTGL